MKQIPNPHARRCKVFVYYKYNIDNHLPVCTTLSFGASLNVTMPLSVYRSLPALLLHSSWYFSFADLISLASADSLE